MVRLILWLTILLIMAAGSSLHVLAQKKVTLASDDWCPFVCGDGNKLISGFLVDTVEEILITAGYQPYSSLLPLNRAMIMATIGSIDGIYAPALNEPMHITKPLFVSKACFYTMKDSDWEYQGPEMLGDINKVISVIDAYGYDDGPFDAYVAAAQRIGSKNVKILTGDAAGERNVKMLLLKRVPIIIEHEMVMSYLLKLKGPLAKDRVRIAGCLKKSLPLVIGFGKHNPIALELIQVINSGLDTLRNSGRMKVLKSKYGIRY